MINLRLINLLFTGSGDRARRCLHMQSLVDMRAWEKAEMDIIWCHTYATNETD